MAHRSPGGRSGYPAPPGAAFLWPAIYLITAASLGLGLYATSLPGWNIGLAILAFVVCQAVAGFWLVSFAVVSGQSSGRMPNRRVAQWFGIPVLGCLTLGLVFLNVPATLRFEASRPALEAAAARTQGGQANPGWIGLFPVAEVRRDEDGTTIFAVDDATFGGGYCGFAYNPVRPPADEADWLTGQIADGWWTWCDPSMD